VLTGDGKCERPCGIASAFTRNHKRRYRRRPSEAAVGASHRIIGGVQTTPHDGDKKLARRAGLSTLCWRD